MNHQLETIPTDYYMVDGKLVPSQATAEEAVRVLLRYVGQVPEEDDISETPARVVRALAEMTEGYKESPADILSKVFEQEYDEIVIVRNIAFTSICSHHLLTFSGIADLGYLPNGKVVGLSKLARLVDCYAKRLQIQERMTRDIALSIQEHLAAKGVAVVVRAQHSCMACRGVKKSGAEMITSVMLGIFREEPSARAEFLSLCKGN